MLKSRALKLKLNLNVINYFQMCSITFTVLDLYRIDEIIRARVLELKDDSTWLNILTKPFLC